MRRVLSTGVILAGILLSAGLVRADEFTGESIRKAFERVKPSMVHVSFSMKADSGGQLEQFLGSGGGNQEVNTLGFVVNDQGFIATNSALMNPPDVNLGGRRGGAGGMGMNIKFEKPESFVVKTQNGKEFTATFFGKEDELGLAFLKIADEDLQKAEPGTLVPLAFTPGQSLALGDPVMCVSLLPEDMDFQLSFSLGRVNAVVGKGRTVYSVTGTSGDTMCSPAILPDGRVAGLVANMKSKKRAGGGAGGLMGMARSFFRTAGVASNSVVYPAEQVLKVVAHPDQSKARKPWLGVLSDALQPITEDLAESWGLQKGTRGVLVGEVLENSPAAKATLMAGDIITAMGETPVQPEDESGVEAFLDEVKSNGVGTTVALKVLRKGEDKKYAPTTVSVVLEEAPPTEDEMKEVEDTDFGFKTKDVSMDFLIRKSWPISTKGARVTSVEKAGWAGIGNIHNGDLILKVDSDAISSVADLTAALAKAKADKRAKVMFQVQRGKERETSFQAVETDWTGGAKPEKGSEGEE